MLVAYRKHGGVPGRLDVRARAAKILDILVSMCEAMDGVIPEAWITHLGHNISHCSGPVPSLTAWRVLRRVECGRSGVHKLRFGKQARFKRVCRGKHERAQALKRISVYVKLAPKTCRHRRLARGVLMAMRS